jgi:hypothetical protein
MPISPDGTRVVGADEHGAPMIYRIDRSAAEPIAGLAAGDVPVQWTVDGRGLIVAHGEGLPWVVERLDLATGMRTPANTIRAHDPAGLRQSLLAISPDAKYYVHSYSRMLSELLVVSGLR